MEAGPETDDARERAGGEVDDRLDWGRGEGDELGSESDREGGGRRTVVDGCGGIILVVYPRGLVNYRRVHAFFSRKPVLREEPGQREG